MGTCCHPLRELLSPPGKTEPPPCQGQQSGVSSRSELVRVSLKASWCWCLPTGQGSWRAACRMFPDLDTNTSDPPDQHPQPRGRHPFQTHPALSQTHSRVPRHPRAGQPDKRCGPHQVVRDTVPTQTPLTTHPPEHQAEWTAPGCPQHPPLVTVQGALGPLPGRRVPATFPQPRWVGGIRWSSTWHSVSPAGNPGIASPAVRVSGFRLHLGACPVSVGRADSGKGGMRGRRVLTGPPAAPRRRCSCGRCHPKTQSGVRRHSP